MSKTAKISKGVRLYAVISHKFLKVIFTLKRNKNSLTIKGKNKDNKKIVNKVKNNTIKELIIAELLKEL